MGSGGGAKQSVAKKKDPTMKAKWPRPEHSPKEERKEKTAPRREQVFWHVRFRSRAALERNSRDTFGGINLCIVEGKSFEECVASAIGTIFRLPHAPIMVGTNRALAGLLAGKQIV